MLIDVYKSTSSPEKYVSVPTGTDISELRIEELDADYRQVSLFKKGVELDSTDHREGLNSAAIIQNIKEHGFAPHAASVTGAMTRE